MPQLDRFCASSDMLRPEPVLDASGPSRRMATYGQKR